MYFLIFSQCLWWAMPTEQCWNHCQNHRGIWLAFSFGLDSSITSCQAYDYSQQQFSSFLISARKDSNPLFFLHLRREATCGYIGWIITRHVGCIFSVNISWFLEWFIGSWNLIPYLGRSVTLDSYVKWYKLGYGGIYQEVTRLLNFYLVPIQLTISQQLILVGERNIANIVNMTG